MGFLGFLGNRLLKVILWLFAIGALFGGLFIFNLGGNQLTGAIMLILGIVFIIAAVYLDHTARHHV